MLFLFFFCSLPSLYVQSKFLFEWYKQTNKNQRGGGRGNEQKDRKKYKKSSLGKLWRWTNKRTNKETVQTQMNEMLKQAKQIELNWIESFYILLFYISFILLTNHTKYYYWRKQKFNWVRCPIWNGERVLNQKKERKTSKKEV